jgi:hypothetical protein
MAGMKRAKWLDRGLLGGPHLMLCLNEADYRRALKRLQVKGPRDWLASPQATATAHTFENTGNGSLVSIVCLRTDIEPPLDGITVAGLLMHEAVHVWQSYCEWIVEDKPGDETEAYAIERIAVRLMRSYVEQTS